jgi:murein DD-endopeptidase MepM/ murein hydrolase activator NlpD
MWKRIFLAAMVVPTLVTQSAFIGELNVPSTVIQGEPLMITVDGAFDTSLIEKISFGETALKPFVFHDTVRALAPVDLNQKPGVYAVKVRFTDGLEVKKDVTVVARKKLTAPLGIPEKLGGNTPASQAKLVSSLGDENAILMSVPSGKTFLPNESFRYPVKEVSVTDIYGYSRQTGSYSIAHKGTDFSAKEGTRVYAMNDGVVRLATQLQTYGKTVVIDHGAGIQSLYLHLSNVFVKNGQKVKKGDRIALSGSTGYAVGPHLHLSIKIDGISINPMKFMELWQ